MKFSRVCLQQISHILPPNEVTSEAIEDRLSPLYKALKLPEGRLELMSGIRARRFWNPNTKPSDVAAEAGAKALEASKLLVGDIDILIHSSVCRDFLEPATASVVHAKLGLSDRAVMYDVSNACLGFLNAMVIIANLIEWGQIRHGMVVGGECGEILVEPTIASLLKDTPDKNKLKSAFASLTIGSGAAAAILSRDDVAQGKPRLLGGAIRTASRHHELCQGDSDRKTESGGYAMATDSEALLQAGISLAGETWADFKHELLWTEETPNRVITHQVGSAHQRMLFESLKLDRNKDFPTFPFLGNTGAVALPTALSLALEGKELVSGQKAALLGIGSGLSCLMLGLG